METYVLLLVLIPLITAFSIPLVDIIYIKTRKLLVITSALAGLLISCYLLISNYGALLNGTLAINYHLGGWSPALGIVLVMDNLGLVFSTLISFTMFLLIFYSIGFIGHHEGKYYVLLFLILGAMQGAVLTGDIFNLYVFVELITITSAALVAFKRNRESTEAALKYIIYGIIGGLFFLLAVFLIYFNLGSLNMSIIVANFKEINLVMRATITAFILTSLLIKMGVFPFHFWLPKAHSACPGPVSALLSGLLLKVFIYIFIRVFWQVTGFTMIIENGLQFFIIYLGLFSSFLGHILALREDDIKRMLAFSTIGHIGMIVAVIALNTLNGLYSGLLHIISHLLMKSTLFAIVGYLLQYTESHHIADFNGVAYKNQGVFIAFIITAMGMVGIPPLPGFFSKYYILQAFIDAGHYLAAVLIIFFSVISLFYYLRYIFRAYNLLDYERGIKPRKVRMAFTAFYRERVVTDTIYVFAVLVVISGLFNWLFRLPLMATVKAIIGG